MLRKKSESVEWLEFEKLQEFSQIKHGVFLRQGDLFVAAREKSMAVVEENQEKIRGVVGCERLIKIRACHGKDITIFRNEKIWPLPFCDGVITQEKESGLLLDHADCQIAIFYDPIHEVIGSAHAGWRGNVQNIYQEMVQRMQAEFSSNPSDLIVCISPSLGPCCGEFKNYQEELPKSFWAYQERPYYFNLWAISQQQLLDCGVLADHIEIAGICTRCHAEDFYSYRRDHTTCRNGTIVALCQR